MAQEHSSASEPQGPDKTTLEAEKLSIERERLELDKKRFVFEQRFMNRYLGTVLTVAVSFGAVCVSLSQVYITASNQQAEAKRLKQQHDFDQSLETQRQQTEWRIRAGNFAAEHITDLFSTKPEVQHRAISLVKVTFQDNAAGILAMVAENQPTGIQKSRAAADESRSVLIDAATSEFLKRPVTAGSSAWLSAPLTARAPSYMYMSRVLQSSLRNKIYDAYFKDVSRYAPNASCAALLVYAALPVTTSVSFSVPEISQFNTDQDVYWDWPNISLRRAMMSDSHTVATLAALLERAHATLKEANSQSAVYFDASRTQFFINLAENAAGDTSLSALLSFEATLIRGAVDTGVRIAGLKASGQAVDIQNELDKLQRDVFLQTKEQRVSEVFAFGGGDVVKGLVLSALSEAPKAFQSPTI